MNQTLMEADDRHANVPANGPFLSKLLIRIPPEHYRQPVEIRLKLEQGVTAIVGKNWRQSMTRLPSAK